MHTSEGCSGRCISLDGDGEGATIEFAEPGLPGVFKDNALRPAPDRGAPGVQPCGWQSILNHAESARPDMFPTDTGLKASSDSPKRSEACMQGRPVAS